ncbi:hypothetical protein LMH81_29635, partial [Vibrio lentus]|nr:hypothetical protein [Vibrio lentus]
KFNNSKRHHIPKQTYKLTNWSEYNQSLMNRGRIDIWINEELLDTWNHKDPVPMTALALALTILMKLY